MELNSNYLLIKSISLTPFDETSFKPEERPLDFSDLNGKWSGQIGQGRGAIRLEITGNRVYMHVKGQKSGSLFIKTFNPQMIDGHPRIRIDHVSYKDNGTPFEHVEFEAELISPTELNILYFQWSSSSEGLGGTGILNK